MPAETNRINALFEKLFEACREHGFSENQLSRGMQYMGTSGRHHMFRDGNSHTQIFLSLKPLKATLSREDDSEGVPYWGEAMLREYRMSDEAVSNRTKETCRLEEFAKSSELWQVHGERFRRVYEEPHEAGGLKPWAAAIELFQEMAAHPAPEYLAFKAAMGSTEVTEQIHYFLSAYQSEQKEKCWAAILSHPRYPEILRLSVTSRALTIAYSDMPLVESSQEKLEALLTEVHDSLNPLLRNCISRRVLSYAPFENPDFQQKLQVKKDSAEALARKPGRRITKN